MFAIAVGRSQKLNLSGWAFNRTLLHVTALKQRWPAKAFSAAYLPIAARSSAEKVVVYFIFLPVVAPPAAVHCIGYNLVHLLQHVGRQSCFFGCGKLVGGLKIAAKAHG